MEPTNKIEMKEIQISFNNQNIALIKWNLHFFRTKMIHI